jgi:hypothetical protein
VTAEINGYRTLGKPALNLRHLGVDQWTGLRVVQKMQEWSPLEFSYLRPESGR